MKKLLSILLATCLIMSMCACAGKDNSVGVSTGGTDKDITVTVAPTATPVPVNEAMTFVEEIKKSLEHGKSELEILVEESNNLGYDIDLGVEFGKLIRETLDDELVSANVNVAIDTSDASSSLRGSLTVDGQSLFAVEGAIEGENIYFDVPKYSDEMAKTTFTEIFGKSFEEYAAELESQISYDSNIDLDKLKASLKDLYSNLFSVIKADMNFIKDVTIGNGVYYVTGTQYKLYAEMSDIQDLIQEFMTALGSEDVLESSEYKFMYIDYIKQSSEEFGIRIYPDDKVNEAIVLIVLKDKGALFKSNDLTEETNEQLYSFTFTRNDDKTGVITLYNSADGSIANEFSYEYDKDFIKFVMQEGITLTVDFREKLKEVSLKADVDGIAFDINFTFSDSMFSTDIDFSIEGEMVLIANFSVKERASNPIEISTTAYTVDTWTENFDFDSLYKDLEDFKLSHPMLVETLSFYITNVNDEDDFDIDTDYTFDSEIDNEGVTNEFSSWDNYAIDDSGFVYFEPTVEDVLEYGERSTGVDCLEITETQKSELVNYIENLYGGSFFTASESFEIYGYEDWGISTEFCMDYSTMPMDSSLYRYCSASFDYITDDFICFNIVESNDNTFKIANDVLKILGVDEKLTFDMVNNEFNWTVLGDFDISYYNHEDYSQITIKVRGEY